MSTVGVATWCKNRNSKFSFVVASLCPYLGSVIDVGPILTLHGWGTLWVVPRDAGAKIQTSACIPRPKAYTCQVSSTSAQQCRSFRVLKIFSHQTDCGHCHAAHMQNCQILVHRGCVPRHVDYTCQVSWTSAQQCRPVLQDSEDRDTTLTEQHWHGQKDGHFYRFVTLISPRERTKNDKIKVMTSTP